jgi:hypothetical protein
MKKLKGYEENLNYLQDYNVEPPSDIVSYTELRSTIDIVRMYNDGELDIQPDFQREFVWNNSDQARFLDSLIKQLPIPSMCLSFDYRTGKWLVIDGLQRISTILHFFGEEEWKLPKLDDVSPALSDRKVREIREDIRLERRLKNLSLPITVIRCDTSNPEHYEYLFTIFHRLNTGGSKLTNQEIRNAIFNGSLNKMLIKLNDENKIWKKICKIKNGKSYRYKFEELILRFFSFQYNLDKYTGNLTSFLNDYMKENKNTKNLDDQEKLFTDTMNILNKIYIEKNFNHSVTVIETLMYAIAKNIDYLSGLSISDLITKYKNVINSDSLSKNNLKSDLSSKSKLNDRLKTATNNMKK